jgi:hypothetical protein
MDKVRNTLARLQKDVSSDKIINWALPRVRDQIVTRTTRGRDIEDDIFDPYSTNYANTRKGGRTQPVTLTDTGQMLDQLTTRKKSSTRAIVFVRTGGHPNRAAVGAAHHRGQGTKRRRWLGMSPSDMRILERDTLVFVDKALRLTGEGLKKKGTVFSTRGNVWTVRNPD